MKFKPTDSTALVMYEPKPKKPKKSKVWLFCILTALISSSISSLAVGGGVYYYLSKNPVFKNKFHIYFLNFCD